MVRLVSILSNFEIPAWQRSGRGGAKGNDGEGQQRRAGSNARSQEEENPIDVSGNDVFLEKHLRAIDDRLQQAIRPDAVGPVAVLHVRRDFALDQDHERHRVEDGERNHGD